MIILFQQELDTSEVVEEEKEADVTNGTADTGADAKDDEKAEAEGAKVKNKSVVQHRRNRLLFTC